MSTSHNNALYLRPFDEIETSVPDLRIDVLPGRLAALSYPLNKGRTVQLPDKELYDPDLATVVSSGIDGLDKGEVVVLAPDHGAFYPNISPDKRELRIVGVACPWWDSVLAKLDADGLHPAPGWMLVEIEQRRHPEPVEGSDGVVWQCQLGQTRTATVIASCGDNHTSPHVGERVCIEGMRTFHVNRETTGRQPGDYRTRPPLALVQAPIASKQWLQSLQRTT